MRIVTDIIKYFSFFLGGICPNGSILGSWTKSNEAVDSTKRTEFCKFDKLKRFRPFKVFAGWSSLFWVMGKIIVDAEQKKKSR